MQLSTFPNQPQHELFVCQFGEEQCTPGHSYGPAVRDHILIHFVASGTGIFICKGTQYTLCAGQGFLIFPGEECFYKADSKNPWHYAWVGYRGSKAVSLTKEVGLDEQKRIFAVNDPSSVWKALEAMRNDARLPRLNQLAALGSLLRFLSLIAPSDNPKIESSTGHQYCERALWFLEGRYDRDVSIQETAEFVGLSRAQLYRVMKNEYHVSPKEMLLQIRMQHAKTLLLETQLTLDEIAVRVGLRTGAQLGVCFRSMYQITPGKFRKKHLLHSDYETIKKQAD